LDVLGSVGQLYMFLLLVVLVMGFGLAAWSAINFITTKKGAKVSTTTNVKQNVGNKTIKEQIVKNKKILGGLIMKSNGFFKLAVFSLVGIFVSAVILTFTSSLTNNQNAMNMQGMNSQMNMNNQSSANGQMNMGAQSNMNGQATMSNMSSVSGQGNQSNSLANIENQLQAMEQQIIQIQQYIQNGNMSNLSQQNSNMNNSTSGGSSSMSMPAAAPAAAAPMAMPMM
jgi:hypothetical protein